jgi:hypothetical protein
MWRLTRESDRGASFLVEPRSSCSRSRYDPGASSTVGIDALGFDQQFIATLGLTASILTLLSLFIFRLCYI